MKILCVIDSLCSGGSQRQIVELALGFKELGHDVAFLTYHNIVFFDTVLITVGIPITCIEEPNYFRRTVRMRRFIRDGNFDGVVAFLEGPSFICEVSGFPHRKWKLAVSEGSANPAIYRSARHIAYRWFHFFTDYVVANSYANMNIVRTVNPFLRSSKCKVVYNIIDFDFWKPLQTYIPRKDGILRILVAARHQYLKNLNGLIDAVTLLSNEEQQHIRIDWYGDWVREPYYDGSFPEGIDKVHRLNLDHVFSFYPAFHPVIEKMQMADAIGLFSYYEGFPNVVCEGMALAKPIICTAVSDTPSLLSYDPMVLSDPAHPETIARSIRYLLHMEERQFVDIGQHNLQIARQYFEKEKNVMGYLELLQ